jgi:hypothetical protein
MSPEGRAALSTPFHVSLRRRYEHICWRPNTCGNEEAAKILRCCRNAALSDIVAAERDSLTPFFGRGWHGAPWPVPRGAPRGSRGDQSPAPGDRLRRWTSPTRFPHGSGLSSEDVSTGWCPPSSGWLEEDRMSKCDALGPRVGPPRMSGAEQRGWVRRLLDRLSRPSLKMAESGCQPYPPEGCGPRPTPSGVHSGDRCRTGECR